MSARSACVRCVFGQNDMKMKKTIPIFGIFVLVGSFLNVFPQQGIDYSKVDDEFLDSVFSIAEVNVVEVKNRQIIKAQTLEGVDLERLNSQSVADALRYFEFAPDGGEAWNRADDGLKGTQPDIGPGMVFWH